MRLSPRPLVATLAVGLLCLSTTPAARASIIQAGGSYTANGTNFTTNYSQNVVVDALPHLVSGGTVEVTLTTVPDGLNAEWNVFSFRTVQGGPLAGNLNAFWQIVLDNIPTSVPALWDGIFFYWTANGTAFDPIFPFGGIGGVSPNPVNPALGPVYGGTFAPFGPFTELDGIFVNVSPYTFVGAGGINPNTANDFHLGLHFLRATPLQDIPEPASLALFAAAGLGLCGAIRRRRGPGNGGVS